MKIVIGLVGPIASGKGTIAKFLVSKGFKCFSLSDVVRIETRKRRLKITRKNLQNIGNKLRENFGGSVLVDRIIEEIKKYDLVVIDGVRNPQEIMAIKNNLNGIIIYVSSFKSNRLKRYLKRAKKRKEDDFSASKFDQINDRDLGKNENKNGQQVAKCLKLADFKLINNSSLSQFYLNFQKILNFIKNNNTSI